MKAIVEEVETLVMDNARILQVLEEIRIISQNWTNKLMNDGYCEILDKINEVLK